MVYAGKRWIDIGIEAIHFGQVELMNDWDPDYARWRDMMGRLRSYVKKHARRHFILTDAHVSTGGIVHEGDLMFDLHSFPCRPKSVEGKPHQAILEKGFSDSIYGRSKGGRTPSGWNCESLPYRITALHCRAGQLRHLRPSWGISRHGSHSRLGLG